jgi:Single-strand binding protein family
MAARYMTTGAKVTPSSNVPTGTYPHRSVCKAIIVGRTGAPPREFEFPNGNRSLTFSIATNETRIRDGEREEVWRTEGHLQAEGYSGSSFDNLV